MMYYFVASKKTGFVCVNYSFLECNTVGRFLFKNQGLNGFDSFQLFYVERMKLEKTFSVYLFNKIIFPPVDELLKAINAFLDIPIEEITLRFIVEGVKHD